MLLNKFVNRLDFTSYEDFHENFKIIEPEQFNFAFDVVDEYANTEPNRLALSWCNDIGESRDFTFGELKLMSDKTANFFVSQGIQKGDAVMLILKRHYEFWFCILALHKIGAVGIPATHLLTSKDIIYRNNAADVKMIVSVNEPDVIRHISDSVEKSTALEKCVVVGGTVPDGFVDYYALIDSQPDTFARPTGALANTNDDPLLLYFTSGTTGYPKMVRLPHNYPLGHIVTAYFWQNVKEQKKHLTVADTGWAKSAWGCIYGQWLCGAVVFVYDYDKFVPENMLKVIEQHKVSTFCAPPTLFRFLIKADLTQYDLSCLEYCAIAGEPLNPEVYNQWLKLTGIKLMEGFGQTEMCIAIATYTGVEPRPGSMGKPSPIYDIVLLDEEDNVLEAGQEGQIAIRTTGEKLPLGMFQGYYRDDERTKSVWHDGYYRLGDIAWQDEDGYLWFVGRSDDVIKSSGYRIGPFEVESALMEHPAVLETAITGEPDPVRGQVIKATIVLAQGYTASEELKVELQNHVKKVTAPYKYPRVVEFVTELPKTISGKIRRVEIREKGQQK
ncbi:MAG: AMP-binding protein [Hyphomonadaceae bacterium]|nr:AMP-binding protein [Clostridia bacterium]